MLHPLNKNKSLKLLLILGTLFAFPPLQKSPYINPAIAHEVEVSGDVAVTFHLEPNHNPRVGQKATIWFVLTRRGGQMIPLSQCNCQLSIYREPRKATDKPLIQPQLKAISAEKYQGIPGTEVIFPTVGIYQLELKGTAKTNNSFKPFKADYSVTVR
ncbi:hypothetical protein PCC9214_04030 [Planktothrix tepida]|uniref:Uncharacterized protein n=2 Tax=Planktothrix TaxID=54304 RepID=A0A1J1LP79_9CYAN|nr:MULTISPECIES: hypothetical protein [Planktothrix]CAD5936075.1 hypothetical protein NO713_01608 [Planktothrix pseudagardhii]CAD5974150.1 hypothetical protein PCC9214_04030 [Planktothrix tepida]CUR34368.1 conserved exported hypothetical protein [Planktothrix tepida PCC 9214]